MKVDGPKIEKQKEETKKEQPKKRKKRVKKKSTIKDLLLLENDDQELFEGERADEEKSNPNDEEIDTYTDLEHQRRYEESLDFENENRENAEAQNVMIQQEFKNQVSFIDIFCIIYMFGERRYI